MNKILQIIAQEFSLPVNSVNNAIELWQEGATVPFIARYRKERTGSLDEVQLRDIFERHTYLTELDKRKETIKDAIASQNKLTAELKAKIEACLNKTELEDLYLPYKPKRRTKATIAREKGLEPLAELIQSLNKPQAKSISLTAAAAKYISKEKEVNTVEEALAGAADIIAETIAEKAEIRAYLREYFLKNGVFTAKIKGEYPEGSTKFEMYRDYQYSVNKIPPHNILALYRGEAEGVLSVDIAFEEAEVLAYLEDREINTPVKEIKNFYRDLLKDAFKRLLKPAIIRELRAYRKN